MSGSTREVPEAIELSGREFSRQEILEIRETARICKGLSRKELAQTICEHLDWRRVAGSNKVDSCLKALEKLEQLDLLVLPALRGPRRHASRPRPEPAAPGKPVTGELQDWDPVVVEPAGDDGQARLWDSLVSRWHYLGYRQAFGARQKYFIYSGRRKEEPLGCLLLAASAWKVGCRDGWIGWTTRQRKERLHLILNNSRFLILPWVRVRNLASHALARLGERVPGDWEERFGYAPVLLETFVDPSRFQGTIYKAANWTKLGQTAGTPRHYRAGGERVNEKEIYVLPLRPDFREILAERR